MILVDSSVWIEFLKKNSPYFDLLLHYLEHREVATIEMIFGELLQGARGKRERRLLQSYWESLPKIRTEDLLLKAGLRSGKEKWPTKGVSLVDACIILAGEERGARIWTLDKHLESLLPKKLHFDPHLIS